MGIPEIDTKTEVSIVKVPGPPLPVLADPGRVLNIAMALVVMVPEGDSVPLADSESEVPVGKLLSDAVSPEVGRMKE